MKSELGNAGTLLLFSREPGESGRESVRANFLVCLSAGFLRARCQATRLFCANDEQFYDRNDRHKKWQLELSYWNDRMCRR